jgi:hypothetical protein
MLCGSRFGYGILLLTLAPSEMTLHLRVSGFRNGSRSYAAHAWPCCSVHSTALRATITADMYVGDWCLR